MAAILVADEAVADVAADAGAVGVVADAFVTIELIYRWRLAFDVAVTVLLQSPLPSPLFAGKMDDS